MKLESVQEIRKNGIEKHELNDCLATEREDLNLFPFIPIELRRMIN
ncbi:MAG: hypothetical protein H3Z52_14195 [archaeon]|nr:hypothetical protein [archaeon]